MKLHLLLTNEIAKTKPNTCKTIMDFGQLVVKFDDGTERSGLHCVVEDTQENIIKWLKPYDEVIKGNGIPQLEQFSIVHVSDN
jgi:hypothetical protein